MIAELVATHGIKNVKVTISSLPIREVLFMAYTSSNDEYVSHEHSLVEKRYKINDGYKVEFEPVDDAGIIYAPQAMYQSDLESLIRRGWASVRVIMEDPIECKYL